MGGFCADLGGFATIFAAFATIGYLQVLSFLYLEMGKFYKFFLINKTVGGGTEFGASPRGFEPFLHGAGSVTQPVASLNWNRIARRVEDAMQRLCAKDSEFSANRNEDLSGWIEVA